MSNKTFKKIMLICFLVVAGSISACVFSYYIFDIEYKVRTVAEKPFQHTNIAEYTDSRMVLDVLYDGEMTEDDILTGIRYILAEIRNRKIPVKSKLMFFNVYTYVGKEKHSLYNGKIDMKTVYKTEWNKITKFDEMRKLISR